jgi:hypothetical protein
MILATRHQTMINGIPAALLAPTPAPKEDHDARHKFSPEPGNLEEAIAALKKIQAYVS